MEAKAKAFSVISTLEISPPHFMTHAIEIIGVIPHINLASLLPKYKNNFSNLIVLKLKLDRNLLLFGVWDARLYFLSISNESVFVELIVGK